MDTRERVLLEKEKRYQKKVALCRGSDGALVSVELNIPYPERTEERFEPVFRAALKALLTALGENGIKIRKIVDLSGPDRRSAAVLTGGAAKDVKGVCVSAEEGHPLGRLFDLDVLDRSGVPIKRHALSGAPRPCLVCGLAALECILLKRHEKREVLEQIEKLIKKGIRE